MTKIISFGTRDGEYDKHINHLKSKCLQYDIAHDLRIIDPTDRDTACLFKPVFVRDRLKENNRPILWLDADSDITGKIRLPADGWDVGVLPNPRWERRHISPITGFAFSFRPTEPSFKFLDMWIRLCEFDLQKGDHARMIATRPLLQGTYSEIDLTPHLIGKTIGDYGTKKESIIQTKTQWKIRKTLKSLERRLVRYTKSAA